MPIEFRPPEPTSRQLLIYDLARQAGIEDIYPTDTYHYILNKIRTMPDSREIQTAILKLLKSQAQANLVAVDQSVKAGTYEGGDTITYPDGSKILIDLESKTSVASC